MLVSDDRAVLVVEDSVVQRANLVAVLRTMGYATILEAGNGLEALAVLDERGAPVELLLTDLDMPRMDGIELIRHLVLRGQPCKLVVMSARDARLLDIVCSMGIERSAVRLLGTLPKPVRAAALARLLEQHAPAGAEPDAAPCDAAELTHMMLAAALEAGQFLPHFQPKVKLASGQLSGVEALARWQHPRHGLLAPHRFLPQLEESPLFKPFTLAMLERSLAALTAWRAQGLPDITMSINLSAAMLEDGAFAGQLDECVRRHGVAPASVVWEVTECHGLDRHTLALPNLARLQLHGYGLAMDDYGSGYSSLQQLLRCPFTEIKLDRSIVHGAARQPLRRTVLESAIALGRKLGAATVAEGVEQTADWMVLRELGCDMVQGFIVARPMPADALPRWLQEQRGRLAALCQPAARSQP